MHNIHIGTLRIINVLKYILLRTRTVKKVNSFKIMIDT